MSKIFDSVVRANRSTRYEPSVETDAETRLSNLFDLSDLEEVDPTVENDDIADPDVLIPVFTNTRISSKQKKNTKEKMSKKAISKALANSLDAMPMNIEYEMEADESEVYFIIYCFFEGFNEMRDYLQERWCNYKEGLLSLDVVSTLTNTAFEMFQEDEKTLLSIIPRSTGLTSFEPIANMLFLKVGLAHVDYDALPDEGEELCSAIGDEAEWVCIPIHWELSNLIAHAPPRKGSCDQ